MEPGHTVIDGNVSQPGHVIVTTIAATNTQPKQTISYMVERVVGQGSFGVVFQAKCLETGETIAIKKVLQDKRYKNRELQTMRLLDHPNIVGLKNCFFSTTNAATAAKADKRRPSPSSSDGGGDLYLNLVIDYVPESLHRVLRHYTHSPQHMPFIFVKLYMYQICRSLSYIHGTLGICHRDIKPQNLLVN